MTDTRSPGAAWFRFTPSTSEGDRDERPCDAYRTQLDGADPESAVADEGPAGLLQQLGEWVAVVVEQPAGMSTGAGPAGEAFRRSGVG